MAKKKKTHQNNSYHFFFKTRLGFYSLSLVCMLLMLSAIKMYAEPEIGVLGKEDRVEKSEGNREEEKAKREEKREERKEEIKQELKVDPEKVKLKFESKGNNVERKIEIEGKKIQVEEQQHEEIEDDIEDGFEDESETEIATDSPDIVIKKNRVKARTGFPLSIDVATNQLIVTRPDGSTKAVSVLPDAAVENFMRHKKVNLINVQEPGTGSESADTTPDQDATASSNAITEDLTQVNLVEKDDKLVYEIKGKKKLKVLGLIPVTTDTKGYVSAETGEVVGQEESIFTKFLNFLSF